MSDKKLEAAFRTDRATLRMPQENLDRLIQRIEALHGALAAALEYIELDSEWPQELSRWKAILEANPHD